MKLIAQLEQMHTLYYIRMNRLFAPVSHMMNLV
jgi:hypothetical protein